MTTAACTNKIPALGPAKGPTGAVVIAGGVADGIVGDGLAVVLRQQVAPGRIPVGVGMAAGAVGGGQ